MATERDIGELETIWQSLGICSDDLVPGSDGSVQ